MNLNVICQKYCIAHCKDAYANIRRDRDMVADVDSGDYICRRVDG